MARRRKRGPLRVESLRHEEAERTNIPSAEHQPLMKDEDEQPIQAAFERRNPDLDPQLVWRGKDIGDWSDLVTTAPPLYIQEKVSPKALIDDLRKIGRREGAQLDFFADFNGLPEGADRTDFYQHRANWSNRMILGDSLQVMASLAEREGLRGQVQCIYIDPPYGISFNSNFQWSTTSRDVRDGKREHITREPEQVKAFRDTWRDGIHSYLTYLRDRLTVARDLLTESGSIFVQIGDENVHRVRTVMDEVFGGENFVSLISMQTTTGFQADYLGNMSDFIVWYARNKGAGKYRTPFYRKDFKIGEGNARWLMFADLTYRGVSTSEKDLSTIPKGAKPYAPDNMISQGRANERQPFEFRGKSYDPWDKHSHWKANYPVGTGRLARAGRIHGAENSIRYVRYHTDFDAAVHGNIWTDTGTGNFTDEKTYVVQTNSKVIERCILMSTDPGDLVLDPTCGSGTTAYVAEQWGRRWITIDTSRVALALARARIMGARYPWYLLADSPDGQRREAEVSGRDLSLTTDHKPIVTTHNDIRHGFVYQRVPHITLGAIANNAEIDVIWEQMQPPVEAALAGLNQALRGHPTSYAAPTGGREGQHIDFSAPDGTTVTLPSGESAPANGLLEWEVPHEPPDDWSAAAGEVLAAFWEARIARQRAIDASIAAKAEFEYLYDKPYEDKRTVRVAGPFTVESLSPHRMLGVDEHGELIDRVAETPGHYGEPQDFAAIILDQLRTAGVQQAHKEDRISFDSLIPWPGDHVCAEGRYQEGGESGPQRRAGVFIGPEFGTVQRQDLVEAAREAAEAGFDLLIACAFNYEAHATEFDKLGSVPVLKARMNADLHMAGELKNTGQGNLFVIFGEPDIVVASGQWLVARNGRMIASYGHTKELSGLGGLEEINRVGGDGLSSLCELSSGREVWNDEPVATGGGVHRGEHRGGSGASRDAGVSALPGDSQRVIGGDGDIPDPGATSGADHGGRDDAAGSAGVGRWANAQRAQTLAALQGSDQRGLPALTDH